MVMPCVSPIGATGVEQSFWPRLCLCEKGEDVAKTVLLLLLLLSRRDHDNFKAFERNADRFVGLGPIVARRA